MSYLDNFCNRQSTLVAESTVRHVDRHNVAEGLDGLTEHVTAIITDGRAMKRDVL